MRVWFSKIHCPSFTCFFCKPPQQLYTPPPAPFKSDKNARTSPSGLAAVVAPDHLALKEELVGARGEGKVGSNELVLKSSVKRKVVSAELGEREGRKKTVKWMDVAGKDLVDVREFETSESEDTDSDSENNRGCLCHPLTLSPRFNTV